MFPLQNLELSSWKETHPARVMLQAPMHEQIVLALATICFLREQFVLALISSYNFWTSSSVNCSCTSLCKLLRRWREGICQGPTESVQCGWKNLAPQPSAPAFSCNDDNTNTQADIFIFIFILLDLLWTSWSSHQEAAGSRGLGCLFCRSTCDPLHLFYSIMSNTEL